MVLAANRPDQRAVIPDNAPTLETGRSSPILLSTVPPIGPYAGYAPVIVDTASTPAPIPSPSCTASPETTPDVTPTIYLTATVPPTNAP